MNATARAIAPVLTDQDIAARIDAYVQRNLSPMVAAERVITDLCREGLAQLLIEQFGPPVLFEVWEDSKRRPHAQQAQEAGERGRARQAELAALRAAGSLLESLVEVDGRWKRLGDLNRATCLKLAATSKRAALQIAQRARFYHAVAQQLQDGQTVRDRLDDEMLTRLRAEAAR